VPHDPKQFLDLLQEHKSDETKKARRNLSTICFIIVAAWLLQLRVTDIRVFGTDLSKSAEVSVLLLAAVLVIYWSIMFFLAWNQDREIQKERVLLLSAEVKRFTERYREIEAKYIVPRSTHIPADYHEVKAAVEAYQAQQARTRRASLYGAAINSLELIVPLALAGAALIVLAVGVRNAL